MPRYLGHLPAHDPLNQYLSHEILPQLGYDNGPVKFRIFGLGGSHGVYLYEERHTDIKIVGKYFGRPHGHSNGIHKGMEREFHALQTLRGRGLTGYPHHVVRPLGMNGALSNLLVLEHVGGRPLYTIIEDAIHHNQRDGLFDSLTSLGYFLATFHNRTASGIGVDFNRDAGYLDMMVDHLRERRFIGAAEQDEFRWLRDRWREQGRMWSDQQVMLHGDATPANLLFGGGRQVLAIDLEMTTHGDRVFDVGLVAGEIQHIFLRFTGNKYAAEPFIGHFLWEYSCHFPDRHAAFRSITGRVPFHMAVTLLRIAGNSWLHDSYRSRLIEEAKITLRTF